LDAKTKARIWELYFLQLGADLSQRGFQASLDGTIFAAAFLKDLEDLAAKAADRAKRAQEELR